MNEAFDTLAAARDLEAAGMERKQAEKIAETIRTVQGDLVTAADIAGVKTNISAVETELKADIAGVKTELKADIAGVKTELGALKWLIGFMAALLIAVAARVFQLL